MREIKFRAWDREAQKMFYSKTEQFDDMLGFRFEHFTDDFPVYMQYTGLKDKNGKEIYEGDILEYKHKDIFEKIYVVGIVKWIMGGFFFKKSKEVIDEWWTANLIYYKKDIKVIGNIYDNPELLNKTDTDIEK